MDLKKVFDYANYNLIGIIITNMDEARDIIGKLKDAGRTWSGGEEWFASSILNRIDSWIAENGSAYIIPLYREHMRHGSGCSSFNLVAKEYMSFSQLVKRAERCTFKY